MVVQNDTTKKEKNICKTTPSLDVIQEYTSFEQILLKEESEQPNGLKIPLES